jgi:hypothetical protein
VCHACSDRLRLVLDDIGCLYAELDDPSVLVLGRPFGDIPRRASVPGPRSPAVDAVIVHTDVRSVDRDRPPALAIVESWARAVREERARDIPASQLRATVPAGRVTMARELATLLFHWDWLMGWELVTDFASEVRAVQQELRRLRYGPDVLLRVKCAAVLVAIDFPRLVDPLVVRCGAAMIVRPGDEAITCRNCGTVWPRRRWARELGDDWADYAALAAEWNVTTALLRQWCRRDGWRVAGTRGRRLVSRADANASYEQRRPR